jgi:hypothetical protein
MKILLLTSCLIFSANSFAETHGGVITANAQMKAVVNYATDSGGDVYRVLKIQKQNSSNVFTIFYGGMNASGKESVTDKETVRAIVLDVSGDERSVKVEHMSGIDLDR